MPENTSSGKLKVLLIYRRYACSFTAYPWVLCRGGKLQVDVLSPAGHAVHASRWVQQFFDFRDDAGLIERLQIILHDGSYAAVLCIDEPARELYLTHRRMPELANYLPFPLDSELNQVATNKVVFQQWCERLGIPVPRSLTGDTPKALQMATQAFRLPYVVKEAVGTGGRQVHIIRNHSQLEAVIPRCGDKEWIVQEYISGSVGTTLFVARRGKLYAHCSLKNSVCMQGGIGPAVICQFTVDPQLEAIAHKIACYVDGLTGFDWMQRGDGSYVVIDPHLGRVTPNAVITHLDGVDFGAAFYQSLIGDEPCVPQPWDSGQLVWLMPRALKLLFEGRCSEGLRVANPFRMDVTVFCGGAGEWRLFLVLTKEILWGNLRVLFGRVWQKIAPESF